MPARPRVLVVEDEALLALTIAEELDDAGFAVVGPALSTHDALGCLERPERCDIAVLDVNLGLGSSEPVARELAARGIPFIVMSGYSRAQLPASLQGMPHLRKPFTIEDLIAELHRLLQQA